jgi:hypothetical protein
VGDEIGSLWMIIMVTLTACATISYCCTLTPEDEQTVLDFMERQDISLNDAINMLWNDGLIDIYDGDTVEGDCDTQEIYDCEIENDED